MSLKVQLVEVDPAMTEACLTAIKVWGQSEQLIQSMGECGEYIAEVGRYFQGRDPDLSKVLEEAADVVILMMQVRELVGVDRFDEVLSKKFGKFSSKVNQAKESQALWRSVADIKPSEGDAVFCPHCGTRHTIKGVETHKPNLPEPTEMW